MYFTVKQNDNGARRLKMGRDMGRYIAKRVLIAAVTLLAITFLLFCQGFFLDSKNYFTSATVSLAIASSSLVGITHTFTLESAVEMIASSPWVASFTAWSTVTPR